MTTAGASTDKLEEVVTQTVTQKDDDDQSKKKDDNEKKSKKCLKQIRKIMDSLPGFIGTCLKRILQLSWILH